VGQRARTGDSGFVRLRLRMTIPKSKSRRKASATRLVIVMAEAVPLRDWGRPLRVWAVGQRARTGDSRSVRFAQDDNSRG